MLQRKSNDHDGQSKDEKVMENTVYAPSQSKASLNILTNDEQVMVAAGRVPSQIRAVDSVGKIGMMVSLNQYLDHWSNYPMLIFSKDKSLILSFFITTPPRPISTFQFVAMPMIV